jgi:hypothetical protein
MRRSEQTKFNKWIENGNAVQDPETETWTTQDTQWKIVFQDLTKVWEHYQKELSGRNPAQYLFGEFLPYLESIGTAHEVKEWKTKVPLSDWMHLLLRIVCATKHGNDFPFHKYAFELNGMQIVTTDDGYTTMRLVGHDCLQDFLKA